MKYLSYLKNNEIVDQIQLPKGVTTDSAIQIDEFLRKCNVLGENQEVAITEDMDIADEHTDSNYSFLVERGNKVKQTIRDGKMDQLIKSLSENSTPYSITVREVVDLSQVDNRMDFGTISLRKLTVGSNSWCERIVCTPNQYHDYIETVRLYKI